MPKIVNSDVAVAGCPPGCNPAASKTAATSRPRTAPSMTSGMNIPTRTSAGHGAPGGNETKREEHRDQPDRPVWISDPGNGAVPGPDGERVAEQVVRQHSQPG